MKVWLINIAKFVRYQNYQQNQELDVLSGISGKDTIIGARSLLNIKQERRNKL